MGMTKLEVAEALRYYVSNSQGRLMGGDYTEVMEYCNRRVAEEKHDEAEAQAGKPETSEPDELQQLEERIDRRYKAFASAVGKDVQGIRSALASVELRLDRFVAWADKLAEWSDQHSHYKFDLCKPKTKAPRLADEAC